MRRRFVLMLPVLLAVTLFAASCGGGETVEPLPDTVEGTIQQETLPEGDEEAGLAVFEEQNCGSCHTLAAADTESTVGPNLDESLEGKDTEYIRTGIVAPDAQIAEGFQAGIMPKNYGEELSDQELADLIAAIEP